MLPTIAELNDLPAAEFERALSPLFEGAPGLLSRIFRGRPFASYEELLDQAERTALAMPEAAQLEVIDSHPRIGAQRETVSQMSHREQGYDRPAGQSDDEQVQAALDRLNTAYEGRFGFRFVVFVAGRPRSEIVPLIEERLRAGREAEKRRALHDIMAIARDRLAWLTAQEGR